MKTLSWSFKFLRCVVCVISQEREINGNILKNHFCRMITRIYKCVNNKGHNIFKNFSTIFYFYNVGKETSKMIRRVERYFVVYFGLKYYSPYKLHLPLIIKNMLNKTLWSLKALSLRGGRQRSVRMTTDSSPHLQI